MTVRRFVKLAGFATNRVAVSAGNVVGPEGVGALRAEDFREFKPFRIDDGATITGGATF